MLRRISHIVVITSILLQGCSEYQKTLNKGEPKDQYALAVKYFENGKYKKAIPLFEKVIPFYRGKPQMERIQFMYSMANYKEKYYLIAAYHFDRFTKNYPRSSRREEAMFLSAKSYYLSTPPYNLDQSDTQTAIESLQRYIDFYPDTEHAKEANAYIRNLEKRLEKKEFEIAYQYLHTEHYKSAVVAFDNFLSEHLGTKYKEDALFYKAKAAYLLAANSVESKQEERTQQALKAVKRLMRNFPEGKYRDEAEILQKKLNVLLNKFKTS